MLFYHFERFLADYESRFEKAYGYFRPIINVIAFIMDYAAVDRIIDHLKLTFVAEKPPPSRVFAEVALMAAEAGAEYL